MKTNSRARTCANPKCRRPMPGARSNAKYCSSRCSSAVAYARKSAETDASPVLKLCFACSHPAERQAEPVAKPGVLTRHPHNGPRSEFSGWCVDPDCPCVKCRPGNVERLLREETERAQMPSKPSADKDPIGTCPLRKRRLSDVLRIAHVRAVRDGRESCSCSGIEGSVPAA